MKIGILGTPGFAKEEFSTSEKLRYVGNNTGNLVFQHAVSSFIKNGDVTFINPMFINYGEALKSKWDLVIFPAASI